MGWYFHMIQNFLVIWAPIWHSEMRDGPILTMWYFRNLLTFVVLQVPLWHPEMPDGPLYQKRICTFHEATCWPTLVKTIDLTRVSAAFILLVIYFSRYDGPPALTKYDIQETKIEVSLVSLKCNKFYLNWSKVVVLEDVEAIRVTITLGRKLLGVLLNVFVPTTILNLIGFSTNFYKVIDGGSLFYDDTWLLKSKFTNTFI